MDWIQKDRLKQEIYNLDAKEDLFFSFVKRDKLLKLIDEFNEE